MFSLIISIIAIALVAALALASIYYGGAAFQEGSADAEASTVINQGQQIEGAIALASLDDVSFTNDLSVLKGTYLKELPKLRDEDWGSLDLKNSDGVNETLTVEVETINICKAIEKRFDGNESVTKATLSDSNTTQGFGCLETNSTAGSEVYTAYYSL